MGHDVMGPIDRLDRSSKRKTERKNYNTIHGFYQLKTLHRLTKEAQEHGDQRKEK